MKLVLLIALLALIGGCGGTSARPIGKPVTIQSPLGLPPVPIPADNPPTAETIALGRKLFHEKRLSGDDTLSCASCHSPQTSFSDRRRYSQGVSGKIGTRNAPSLWNSAFALSQFWDGRAATLEDQAGGPMANPIEMNQSHEVSVAKLQADPEYRRDFENAFGPGPVTIGRVRNAIASFERTLLSGNSPFDRYQYGGDRHALSPAAERGLALFRDPRKGNCAVCHTIEEKYALFTDGKFHNIGAGVNEEGEVTDPGRFKESKAEADKGAFKTPSLRNVAESAPYMHDGSLKSLRDVVDFYAGGANSNPQLDREIRPRPLTAKDRDDLVEFLKSLTGQVAQ